MYQSLFIVGVALLCTGVLLALVCLFLYKSWKIRAVRDALAGRTAAAAIAELRARTAAQRARRPGHALYDGALSEDSLSVQRAGSFQDGGKGLESAAAKAADGDGETETGSLTESKTAILDEKPCEIDSEGETGFLREEKTGILREERQ